MRWITSMFVICLVASSASARGDHRARLAVPPRDLPPACFSVAGWPRDAQSVHPALHAAVSAAGCMAIIRMRAVQLRVTPQGIAELDAAMQPSISLLDTVIDAGDTEMKIIALHAKADLYAGAAQRLRASDPHHPRLVALVQPWLDRSEAAHRDVVALARCDRDEVRTNPVVAFDVGDSGFERGEMIASGLVAGPPIAAR